MAISWRERFPLSVLLLLLLLFSSSGGRDSVIVASERDSYLSFSRFSPTMLWQFLKRHRRKLILLSFVGGGRVISLSLSDRLTSLSTLSSIRCRWLRCCSLSQWQIHGNAQWTRHYGNRVEKATLLRAQSWHQSKNKYGMSLYFMTKPDIHRYLSFRYWRFRPSYSEYKSSISMRTNSGKIIKHIRVSRLEYQCARSHVLVSSSNEKRELWEQLRVECKWLTCPEPLVFARHEEGGNAFLLLVFSGFARLFTFAYSSSFVLALTELVVSALSGRLYSQSQMQNSSSLHHSLTRLTGGIAATPKSSHAEVSGIIWKETRGSICSASSQIKSIVHYSREIFN